MDLSLVMDHIDAIGLVPILVWQSIRMEKKLDAQGWERQLVAMVNKYEDRESEIRARYDRVVETYNTERDRLFRDMDRKLDDAIRFFQSR